MSQRTSHTIVSSHQSQFGVRTPAGDALKINVGFEEQFANQAAVLPPFPSRFHATPTQAAASEKNELKDGGRSGRIASGTATAQRREFFAVRRGMNNLSRCIFTNWEDCSLHVVSDDEDEDGNGSEEVEYSSFDRLESALAYVDSYAAPAMEKRPTDLNLTPDREENEVVVETSHRLKDNEIGTPVITPIPTQGQKDDYTSMSKGNALEEAGFIFSSDRDRPRNRNADDTRGGDFLGDKEQQVTLMIGDGATTQFAVEASHSPKENEKETTLKVTEGATKYWNIMYAELLRYKKTHGHCRMPPKDSSGRRTQLGSWVESQKKEYKSFVENQILEPGQKERYTSMTQGKVQALEEAGFIFSSDRGRPRNRNAEDTAGGDQDARTAPDEPKAGWPGRFPSSYLTHARTGSPPSKADQQWEDMYSRLLLYKAQNGTTSMPDFKVRDGETAQLRRWVDGQRKEIQLYLEDRESDKRSVSDSRCLRLMNLGLGTFPRRKRSWEETFLKLREFRDPRRVVILQSDDWKEVRRLNDWLKNQRKQIRLYEEGVPISDKRRTVSDERCERLLGVGTHNIGKIDFSQCPTANDPNAMLSWGAMYNKLLEFKEKHGTADVPYNGLDDDDTGETKSLGHWVDRMRKQMMLFQKKEERGSDCKENGSEQSEGEDGGDGEEGTEEIANDEGEVEDAAMEGVDDTPTPATKKRALPERLCIDTQQARMLIELGLDEPRERRGPKSFGNKSPTRSDLTGGKTWDELYEEMRAYKAEHGNLKIPYNPWTTINEFMAKQRREYRDLREGKPSLLTALRVQKLNDLGFSFKKKIREPWEERFKQLLAFKAEHGHVRVQRDEKGLGPWVHLQRVKYNHKSDGRETNLTDEQIDRLNSIGFVWNVLRRPQNPAPPMPWEERFQQLVEFKKEYGHTSVPQHYPALGNWVHGQRVHYKWMRQGRPQSSMTPERALKLSEIGFTFEVKGRKNRYITPESGLSSKTSSCVGGNGGEDSEVTEGVEAMDYR